MSLLVSTDEPRTISTGLSIYQVMTHASCLKIVPCLPISASALLFQAVGRPKQQHKVGGCPAQARRYDERASPALTLAADRAHVVAEKPLALTCFITTERFCRLSSRCFVEVQYCRMVMDELQPLPFHFRSCIPRVEKASPSCPGPYRNRSFRHFHIPTVKQSRQMGRAHDETGEQASLPPSPGKNRAYYVRKCFLLPEADTDHTDKTACEVVPVRRVAKLRQKHRPPEKNELRDGPLFSWISHMLKREVGLIVLRCWEDTLACRVRRVAVSRVAIADR
jgi:hypothetical protein